MTKIVLYYAPLHVVDAGNLIFNIKLRSYQQKWIDAHPHSPSPQFFKDDINAYLGWNFDSSEEAAIFKLTHL